MNAIKRESRMTKRSSVIYTQTACAMNDDKCAQTCFFLEYGVETSEVSLIFLG